MENKSIFVDPPVLKGNARERVSILATEHTVCDAYLKMGYTSSNGVNISSRVSYLDKEIKRLSDMSR